jgi:hypothetical protein
MILKWYFLMINFQSPKPKLCRLSKKLQYIFVDLCKSYVLFQKKNNNNVR